MKRVRTYLEAGYVIYVEHQMESSRDIIKSGFRPWGANHVAVIDGYRKTYQDEVECSATCGVRQQWRHGSFSEKIQVVCSLHPEPYWISPLDWIENHGGFNMRFVRTRREKRSPEWGNEEATCPDHPREAT